MSLLFSPTSLGPLTLKNRLVMAPLTRNRAIGNVPSTLMADYYSQRATAGLIITEGTSPSPNGLGYPRIPGVTTSEEVQGWARVATAVHAEGGVIFMQLMHCGRIAHPLNMPDGTRILAPSAIAAAGDAVVSAIGADKVGIRLSPFGVFNDMPLYDAMEADYTYLAEQLNARGILYVHLVDHSSMGTPTVPASMTATFRRVFTRTLILSGGYDAVRAERALEDGRCDLVAFGRSFLANPDLVCRWQLGSPLNTPDASTFYTPGPAGYTDYPTVDAGLQH